MLPTATGKKCNIRRENNVGIKMLTTSNKTLERKPYVETANFTIAISIGSKNA